MSVFVIVGGSEPLYEVEFNTQSTKDDSAHLNQFIVHSALDTVEHEMWDTASM
jgi:hypothetical protein